MTELFRTLINFSERAGEIARSIRKEPTLFSLLVEEKGEEEKNIKFAQDFKTLSDVLIQEALRHHIEQMYPSLGPHVHGEESAEFTNTLGENITVRVCETQEQTANLLAKVLDGNMEAASLLAAVVHSEVTAQIDEELIAKIPELPVDNLGIWIDPIDSTAEYVKGNNGNEEGGLFHSGLPCVTVLIGLFHRDTGLPIGGVVNQPFANYCQEKTKWVGEVFWGASYNSSNVFSLPTLSVGKGSTSDKPLVILSSSEDKSLQEELSKSFQVFYSTGAGYKGLSVVMGMAAAYLCTKGSTYRWDTCAPHSILLAQGGGIVNLQLIKKHTDDQCITKEDLESCQIRYHQVNPGATAANKLWNNNEGFIAYQDPQLLTNLLQAIKDPPQEPPSLPAPERLFF
ncbi:unnamed protein product, partial [Meganyctiphanes norvegica]